MKSEFFELNIPTGLNNTAQGCGTPLPWGNDIHPLHFTPKGLRHVSANAAWENRRNSVGVEKREGMISLTQGSGSTATLGFVMQSRWDIYVNTHILNDLCSPVGIFV